jgi:hypothetical protein
MESQGGADLKEDDNVVYRNAFAEPKSGRCNAQLFAVHSTWNSVYRRGAKSAFG